MSTPDDDPKSESNDPPSSGERGDTQVDDRPDDRRLNGQSDDAAADADAADAAESDHAADSPVVFVVGIGASAGGLRPLQEFFTRMPTDSKAAFVVIQHLSPDFKSLMPELIGRQTKMPAVRLEDGMRAEPNTIYLNTPRTDVTIEDGVFHVVDRNREPDHGPHFPIDLFFRSLASDLGEHSIGIILSGTGSDGSRGVREINEAGGVVLAQDPRTCQFDGMPQATITTGHADCVQRPSDLARTVYEYVEKAGEAFPRPARDVRGGDQDLVDRIISVLEQSEHTDFSHYKRSTIGRRIERRRLLAGKSSLGGYLEMLETSAEERAALRNDLLITVTSFFRDAAAWRILEEQVVPRILADTPPDRPIRIWVTACATGEEAYSIAMLLIEEIEKAGQQRDLKIFATDIDEKALERASAGTFPRAIVGDIDESRLRRFFQWKDGHYEVRRELREKIIFAPQNLAQDAPFTRMDLVTCRNVLIYMEPELQQHVVRMLHFALNVSGILFMGAADVVGPLSSEFETIDSRWKIFRKRRDVRLVAGVGERFLPRPVGRARATEGASSGSSARPRDPMLIDAMTRMLGHRGGVVAIVGSENELVQAYGATERFLRVPRGQATSDITRLVPKAVQLALHTALHKVRSSGEERAAVFRGLRVEFDDGVHLVCMRVEPLSTTFSGGNQLILVTIDEDRESGAGAIEVPMDVDDAAQMRIRELENDLAQTRENLQATIEELETTNEEQQAGNEELLASNEELQSTNEELHSLNEELYTVNAEYQAKIQELTELHHDMDNLLMSTNIGTIFLDAELRVRKFTPAATDAFNLVDVDVGRPIEHLSHNLEYPHLFEDLRAVLLTGRSVERDTRTKRGKPLLVRINPYRTEQTRHQGVVVTFIDIGELKQAERDLKRRAEELAGANRELDRFNRLAIGREDRIIDLKREINTLAAELGRTPPYDLAFVETIMSTDPMAEGPVEELVADRKDGPPAGADEGAETPRNPGT
jgi:chemotaxis methyl-accepting protein methylase